MISARSSGFFALRTPLLPIDDLLAWSSVSASRAAWERDEAPEVLAEAWANDVATLRSRLLELIGRADLLEALYIASPSLVAALTVWRNQPDSKKGQKVERALVRYFTRMATRPTPFGLFAGHSVGLVEDGTATGIDLRLAARERYERRTRLDFDVLFAVAEHVRRQPAIATELTYRPNDSLLEAPDVWHYIESRVSGRSRSHHLVSLDKDRYLRAALECARSGAGLIDIASAVQKAAGNDVLSPEEAREYALELISNDVLRSDVSPPVTGVSPLDDLVSLLTPISAAADAVHTLRTIRNNTAWLDTVKLGLPPEAYSALRTSVESLAPVADNALVFQVDMVKPSERLVIDQRVIDEVLAGVEAVCRLSDSENDRQMATFKEAFVARYESAWVPLAEALDEEYGIGFGDVPASHSSPLVRGLGLAGRHRPPVPQEIGPFHAHVLQLVAEAMRSGAEEVEIDIDAVSSAEVAEHRLPGAFAGWVTLTAASADAVRRGDFSVHLHGVTGPSGAPNLGRFCDEQSELTAHVRRHIEQEEARDPHSVYAEVVYLPEGRLGNVLWRPLLREYEIVYLGRSGAPMDRQIPVSDLLVTVAYNTVVLYSRRLHRRVIPRLTNAHSYQASHLPAIYRFLGSLQNDFGGPPRLPWGPLNALPWVPRLRCGRVTLSRQTWQLRGEEFHLRGGGATGFVAVQHLRRRRQLPRWVVIAEADNALPIDLDNPLSVITLTRALGRQPQLTLQEYYPPTGEMCVTGPEGRFGHEMIIPFVRQLTRLEEEREQAIARHCSMATPVSSSGRARRRPPGSEWLYVKIHGGAAVLDRFLAQAVPPLLQAATTNGLLSRWFFVRYADPSPQLRLRFRAQPGHSGLDVFSLATERWSEWLEAGSIWRVELDTYHREVERYGGIEGVRAAEALFCADSEAVLAIVAATQDHEIERWRLALLGADTLMQDCGLSSEERYTLIRRMAGAFSEEHHFARIDRVRLGDRFRRERAGIEALLAGRAAQEGAFGAASAAFRRRSARLQNVVARLHELKATGALNAPLEQLIDSYVHMHVNRMMPSAARAQETVLYDFLTRIYEGKLGRTRLQHADLVGDTNGEVI